jgi:drug/metabolite transporter (DMT)-like permease
MLVFYWIGTVAFLPLSDFSTLPQLTHTQWVLVIFCGLNTIIAYGCFAEALVHTEASRVSATIAITPLITIAIAQLIPITGLVVEPLTWLSITGALLVVVGSMLAALASNRKRSPVCSEKLPKP